MVEKILVSACLLGEKCRYDGKDSYHEEIVNYVKNKEVFAVCPEVMGGLSTPRKCCEIKAGRVVDCDGEDHHDAFIKGAQKVLEIAKKERISQAILKSKSPSCGFGKIYSGNFASKLVEGNGICAALLHNNSIKVINSDEFIFKKENETKKHCKCFQFGVE